MRLKRVLLEVKRDDYAIVFAVLGELLSHHSGMCGIGKYKGTQIVSQTIKKVPGVKLDDLRATGQQTVKLIDKNKVINYLKDELKKRESTLEAMPDMSDLIQPQIDSIKSALKGDVKYFRNILKN